VNAAPQAAVPAEIRRVVDAPDRSAADRALDAGRHPAEMLAFFGVHAGMRVADLAAGGGYTTELLARAVGPTGVVYGQNPKLILERYAEAPWSERLRKPVMQNVVRVDSEFDEPLPLEAHDLDAVFMILFYHDTIWMGADRARLNRAVFRALKPGGVFAIVDHSARAGAGVSEVKTLHRIEESVVREEIEAAGFRLGATGNFLRNPSDPRDWNDSPSAAGERRGTSDRFVLAFVKPQ
jgi:predicted methyltransferase